MATLSDEQVTEFAADLATNLELTDEVDADDNVAILEWYNALTGRSETEGNVEFWILKRSVGVEVFLGALDWDGQGPNGNGRTGEYWYDDDPAEPGTEKGFKDDIPAIQMLFFNRGTYNPVPENNRRALNRLFESAPQSKQGGLGVSVEKATEIERIYAEPASGPGGGDGSQNSKSANPIYKGPMDEQDVARGMEIIRNNPTVLAQVRVTLNAGNREDVRRAVINAYSK